MAKKTTVNMIKDINEYMKGMSAIEIKAFRKEVFTAFKNASAGYKKMRAQAKEGRKRAQIARLREKIAKLEAK